MEQLGPDCVCVKCERKYIWLVRTSANLGLRRPQCEDYGPDEAMLFTSTNPTTLAGLNLAKAAGIA
jgi:hypothetical protein